MSNTYTVEELVQGYVEAPGGGMRCIACGDIFYRGEVYPLDGRFFDAPTAIKRHVQSTHPDYFVQLLQSPEKQNTLTQKQREFLLLFYQGVPDQEIAKRLSVAPATVRQQKFLFRERAKQAAHFLAVHQLAMQHGQEEDVLPILAGETMVDDRYLITQQEQERIEQTVFSSLSPLRLKRFPGKAKRQVVVLRRIIQAFEENRQYSEREVNEILQAIYEDYAMLRRYLVEYGHLHRKNDGSAYWRPATKGNAATRESCEQK